MRADQWIHPLGCLSSLFLSRAVASLPRPFRTPFPAAYPCSFFRKGERGGGGRERPSRSVCAVLIRCNAVPREPIPSRHLVRARSTTRGTRVPSARLGDVKTLELIGPRSRRNLRKVNRIGAAGRMRTYLDAHATRVRARS